MTQSSEQIDQLKRQLEASRRDGQLDQALAAAVQITQQVRETDGAHDPAFAAALNTMAELSAAAGKTEDARRLWLQAQQILEQTGEPPADLLGLVGHNLGLLYLAQGHFEQADKQLTEALTLRQQTLAADHPAVAQSLNGLGRLQLAASDYNRAQQCFEQALDIAGEEEEKEETGLTRADSLRGLGQVLQARGAYLQAEPKFAQALTLRRAVLGPNHPDIAQSLLDVAGLQTELSDYANAESLYQEALAINRRALGEQHPAYAGNLEHLARLYQIKGDYDQAETHYKQALQLQRTRVGEKHPDFAHSVVNLAGLYHLKHETDQARQLFLLALQVERAALGDKHPAVARTKNALARLYHTLGDYEPAQRELNEALAIQHETLGEDHPAVATTRHNLAELALDKGDYRQADEDYRAALRIRQAALGKTHPVVGASLHSLARLYQLMADFKQAKPLFEQALAIRQAAFGERHLAVADTLHHLAETEVAVGDIAAAEARYKTGLDIRREKLGQAHPDVARSLGKLAELYLTSGRYEQSEPLFLQAVKIWQDELGREHPDFAASLHNLATLYHARGDTEQANTFYRWAAQIRTNTLGEQHPAVAQTLSEWAKLEVATERDTYALEKFDRAAAIEEQMIGQVFSIGSERQRLVYLTSFRENFDTYLSLLSGPDRPDRAAAARSGLELNLRRKAIGLEAMAMQRDVVLGGRYPELKGKLDALHRLSEQIAQKSLAGPGSEGVENHQRILGEWQATQENLEAALARQIPEIDLSRRLRQIKPERMVEALPPEAALIEFVRFNRFDFTAKPTQGDSWWQPAHYLAFVLLAAQPDAAQMIDLGEAGPVDRLIARYRESITGEGEDRGAARKRKQKPQADSDTIGSELRAALFDPLSEALDDCRRLFIAPDGDLTRLPFEILPLAGERRLLDDYRISYLSVGRDLLRFSLPAGAAGEALVVANPDFDLVGEPAADGERNLTGDDLRSEDFSRAGFPFGPLAGTAKEGEAVANMLAIEPLLQAAAVERRLKACQSPHVLHVATHGFFLEDTSGETPGAGNRLSRLARLENPLLRSGLALAGANSWYEGKPLPEEAQDGILTAQDVSGLSLLNTELVVLSACETGLGEVQVGEGVFGLRRAFMLAGAKTLVMSLWKVPDRETQELMTDFYRRVLAGEPRAEALRAAQLAIKAKQPNPYFWGAFICQGQPGSLHFRYRLNVRMTGRRG